MMIFRIGVIVGTGLTCIVAAMISEVMPGTWTTKIPRMIPNGLMKHIRTRYKAIVDIENPKGIQCFSNTIMKQTCSNVSTFK